MTLESKIKIFRPRTFTTDEDIGLVRIYMDKINAEVLLNQLHHIFIEHKGNVNDTQILNFITLLKSGGLTPRKGYWVKPGDDKNEN